jgi:hypothetical protein
MDEKPEARPMGQVIQIDEARIRDHLGEMVRGTVEEALNAMLDAEADRLCGARRYERSEARKDTRAGSYERSLETRAGQPRWAPQSRSTTRRSEPFPSQRIKARGPALSRACGKRRTREPWANGLCSCQVKAN